MLTPKDVLKRTNEIKARLEPGSGHESLTAVYELVDLFGDVCTQWAADRALSTGAPQDVDSDLPLGQQLAEIDAKVAQLEARRLEVYKASLEAPAEDKACANALSELIIGMSEDRPDSGFPWEVRDVAWDDADHLVRREPQLVAVRPVGDPVTYVGILTGDLPLGVGATFNRESGVLHLKVGHHNPAIVVPALKRVVMGCESWWGKIESEEQLKQITDEDIDNVWYVKALCEMTGEGK